MVHPNQDLGNLRYRRPPEDVNCKSCFEYFAFFVVIFTCCAASSGSSSPGKKGDVKKNRNHHFGKICIRLGSSSSALFVDKSYPCTPAPPSNAHILFPHPCPSPCYQHNFSSSLFLPRHRLHSHQTTHLQLFAGLSVPGQAPSRWWRG